MCNGMGAADPPPIAAPPDATADDTLQQPHHPASAQPGPGNSRYASSL